MKVLDVEIQSQIAIKIGLIVHIASEIGRNRENGRYRYDAVVNDAISVAQEQRKGAEYPPIEKPGKSIPTNSRAKSSTAPCKLRGERSQVGSNATKNM